MRILVDVCLSPQWVDYLQRGGVDAVHWTSVGNPRAADREIIEWARKRGCIVFTHDLDFGALLALTRATGPSVVQILVAFVEALECMDRTLTGCALLKPL